MANGNSIQTPVGANPPKELDEFEIMRRRLQQRGAVQGDQAQRQLNRQFASLGNLPSGAALRQSQLAQREIEAQTSQNVQDVNLAEAQTRMQEREAEKGRALQRFGIETQAKTAMDVQGLQGSQALEQQKLQGANAMELAKFGAASDIEMAKLQGANAQDLTKLQGEINLRAQQLAEFGTNERFVKQISENRKLFDLEQRFNREGRSMSQAMAERGMDIQEQELAMNKSVTVLNSLEPLKALGFSGDEVGAMLEALGLPFANEIKQSYIDLAPARQLRNQFQNFNNFNQDSYSAGYYSPYNQT